ncbi:OmpA family protein [Aurantiacibacter marinus]|uniref:OmpA family protein n=1 Tax=Aurantiacibacter marinus TaxID=874156 RepID=A0A0H0XN50_9SPHN|nr:OmpA family protein [Aurantiacibacter marinus]KLI63431.1 OmpA family protein [Aurantiacibacter marinus]
MNMISNGPKLYAMAAILAVPAMGAASVSAQELDSAQNEEVINVYGSPPTDLSGLAQGPDIEGFISARTGNTLQITSPDGTTTTVRVSEGTDIRGRGGLLGLGRTRLTTADLLNGLPVTVGTVQWSNSLLASRVRFSNSDLETAAMIRGATSQRFAEQGEAIEVNAAATEALRGRVANIDQYNVTGVTNVYFDTGRWNLTPSGESELCSVARQANETPNALLLVVGYTDSVGDQDYNQVLSERRAGRVVNFLQQECDWAPYRMMTPTGMAESDPLADNSTPAGRAQNRRVSVNILVSKALDGA